MEYADEMTSFLGLDPESVSRHRLNIAELTKLEHDMYLVSVLQNFFFFIAEDEAK